MAFLKELNFKIYMNIITYLVTNIFSLTVLERIATADEMSIFGIKIRTLGRPENREGKIQGLLKGKKFASIPAKIYRGMVIALCPLNGSDGPERQITFCIKKEAPAKQIFLLTR